MRIPHYKLTAGDDEALRPSADGCRRQFPVQVPQPPPVAHIGCEQVKVGKACGLPPTAASKSSSEYFRTKTLHRSDRDGPSYRSWLASLMQSARRGRLYAERPRVRWQHPSLHGRISTASFIAKRSPSCATIQDGFWAAATRDDWHNSRGLHGPQALKPRFAEPGERSEC